MYKCDKCICMNCKNYFNNGGDCEQCLMCGKSITISDNDMCNECDDFELYKKVIKINNLTLDK